MRINTNVQSLQAQEAATNTQNKMRSSLEKLGTGLAINKASDDGSGLAIADKLRTQASSIGQAMKNGNAAITMMQMADKAMSEQSNILDTIKTKLVQAATGTTSDEGRHAIAKDIDKLLDQVNNIAKSTNYNGTYLLQQNSVASAGTGADQITFQMGELSGDNIQTRSNGVIHANVDGLSLNSLRANVSGEAGKSVGSAGSVFSQGAADALMKTIDRALSKLDSMRSDYGSTQVQLESSVRNLSTAYTNLKASESVIRDVDYAKESAEFNKQNIIAQAGTYAMSQANAMQQNVMRLLQ
jgi:flagellin